jgi:type II secretory pathway component PulM
MKRGELQEQINQYEQQLKGLKSILTSIDKDIPEVEAERHASRPNQPIPLASSVEFEDNEFMAVDAATK